MKIQLKNDNEAYLSINLQITQRYALNYTMERQGDTIVKCQLQYFSLHKCECCKLPPRSKKLGTLPILWVCTPLPLPSPPPPCSVAIWQILSDLQFCDGRGRGDQPGVTTILSGVVGKRRKNASQWSQYRGSRKDLRDTSHHNILINIFHRIRR